MPKIKTLKRSAPKAVDTVKEKPAEEEVADMAKEDEDQIGEQRSESEHEGANFGSEIGSQEEGDVKKGKACYSFSYKKEEHLVRLLQFYHKNINGNDNWKKIQIRNTNTKPNQCVEANMKTITLGL